MPAHSSPAGRGQSDDQLASIVADLVRRVRPACRDWDDAAFDALVHEMAARQLRWAALDGHAPGDRRDG